MVKIFVLLNILILKVINLENEQCIYSFHCQKEDMGNTCLKKIKTDSDNIFDVTVNSCSKDSSCNVYNALIGDREKNIKCQENIKENEMSFKRPSYINGTCINDSQCLNGICNNDSICINYNKICYSHENCPINRFCDNGECKNYLNENETCRESYQCQFNCFCDKKDNKCKKLFSYKDGESITENIDQNFNVGEICESGGYIEIITNKKTSYVCETLFNDNFLCKTTCKYKTNKKEKITLENRCLCGYNKYRKKYCVLGNGEKEFKDYLRIRKYFLFNEDYIKKCHTLERDSDEICNELINTNNSVSFRKYVQNYKNLKIKALEFHRIKESDSCIKEVIFGYNTNPIIPLNQRCPKYVCDDNIKQCLYGINPFNENGDNTIIKLNENVCAVNEQCTLNNIFLTLKNLMTIMENENIEGKCSIYSYWPGIRYPGEDCNVDSDCVEDFKCQNGKCSGKENGEKCNKTLECKVGFYCNKDSNKCAPQKKEGEPCKEGWDCVNYLGCYRGRCTKLGILKPGVLNTQEIAPFPGDEKRYLFCNTGELEGDDGMTGNYCVNTKYSEGWIKKEKKIKDENGFIKCEYKESCYYDNTRRTIKKMCGCGYNNDGQGYCPLPSSLRIEDWNDRIKYIADFANNGCHSLSRYNCYIQNTMSDYITRKIQDKKTIEAHLFYNAVPCAVKMLSFENYLCFNLLSFILLYILFF